MPGIKQLVDLDFGGIAKIVRALVNPVAADPGAPVVGEVWFNSTDNRLKVHTGAGTVALATTADSGSGIPASTLDAQSVLAAIADDTPIAITVGASQLVGRLATGDVGAQDISAVQALMEAAGIDASTVGGADPFARANHTGSQAASTISDFNAQVDARIQLVVDTAPTALDTLNELAAALGDDPNFAATVTSALAAKPGRFAANVGDSVATSIAVAHNLGTTDVIVQVFEIATGATVECDVVRTNANTATLGFNVAPATNSLRVVVHGIS